MFTFRRSFAKLTAICLSVCMLFTAACAEEAQSGTIWDSIGGWASQAWESTSGWASQAWESTSGWASQAWSDAHHWVEGAWGDASRWVEQAWNGSSEWVTNIWGDVSSWAAETYASASESVSTWWTETFKAVTRSADDSWKWLTRELTTLQEEFSKILSDIRDAVRSTGSDASAKVRGVFISMLKQLKLNEADSQKVLDTIAAYAEQKGISVLTASKLALPYLLQLTADSAKSQETIPPVAIAQYLTAVIEKLNINSADAANELVEKLNAALNGN